MAMEIVALRLKKGDVVEFFCGMFTTVTWINMDIGGSSKEGLQGVRARRRCQAVML